jgi:molybdate transport system ATP-binding protein
MSILDVKFQHHFPSGFDLNINFQIDHLITSIFGSSGSGKTSILAMIAGLKAPTTGKILLNGRVLYDSATKINIPIYERKVGIIFQDHLLFPHLSVENNLKYAWRSNVYPQQHPDFERVYKVLEIDHLLSRYPRSLSGGECQRVAIGRTLLSNPEALLMDEPLASLDDRLRDCILNYLERIIEEWNIPAIFISHNQSLVQRFSSHTIIIDQGRVLSSGDTSSTIENYGPDIWKSAKGPMNWLKIEWSEIQGSFTYASVFGQKLLLPITHNILSNDSCIQFSASEVVLSRNAPNNISSRNHLQGKVVRFVEQNSDVLVGIDIGKIIWAKITLDAKYDLELEIGSPVYCLIKTQAFEYTE